MLRLPATAVPADRGKNHDPAAMPPDLTSASRRAQLRQDRYAPLRGGLRPVLTQSPRGACNAHGPGRKAALQAEQKAILGLETKGMSTPADQRNLI
jgi:hypothetical protein